MATRSVIIVGAGAGGIATATKLAKAGFQVTVIEKHGFVGGRCSLIRHDGYRFDQGPSLFLMPELFEEAFEDVGTSMNAEGVKLLKCEPNYRVWFPDNDCFELSTDIVKMKQQIEAHEGKDGFHRFLAFMQESGKHYDLSVKHVLRKNFSSYVSILRPDFFATIFDMHPFESIYGRITRYFTSDKMRRVFTFASMYLGMNPYEAPATYSLLQYTEIAHGIAYPVGGFQTVLQALADVGKRTGVKYLFNSPVNSVLLSKDQKTVEGVKLENGKELRADLVVINADLVYAYNNLLPSSKYARSLKTRAASCSSISFFWSFDSLVSELDVHNIFLADQYSESFDAIFKKHSLPEDPSFYVNVPSRIDKTAAPPGKDAVVVLVPIGHLLENQSDVKDWDALVANTRNLIFDTIETRTGARNLRQRLLHEDVNTPVTWREKFNLDRGAILGLSHSFFNVLCWRPKTRHDDIKGLYFVGASTHPGTGVPVCLAGGKIVSEQIINDWSPESRKGTGLLTQVLRPLLLVSLLLVSLLLVLYNLVQTGGHWQRVLLMTSV